MSGPGIENQDRQSLERKHQTECRKSSGAPEAHPELMRADIEEVEEEDGEEEGACAVACVGQLRDTLVQLQRSGLVRRRAERLERLSSLSQEGLLPLQPSDTFPGSEEPSGSTEEQVELPVFPGDFPKSSTPCQVRLEPLVVVVPLTNEALLGVVASGGLTPTSSPHGSTLTRSSSNDSLRSVRGKPGLVRQRAQEIETRMRLAGLTVSSRLKRSNSLAKMDSLNFSSEDLCSVCSSDAGTLLLSLSPEPEPWPEWDPRSASAQPRPRKDLANPERGLPDVPRS